MKELTDQEIRGVARDVQKRQPAYYDDLALSRSVIAADRALNAPAEQSTAREQDTATFIRRIVSMVHRDCEDDSNLFKLANEAWYYLARNNLLSAPFRDAGIESDVPVSPLIELRAKVAKIQAIGENQRYFQAVVLDLIDKMGET